MILPRFSGGTRFNTMKTALILRTHFALSDKQKFVEDYRQLISSIRNKLPKTDLHILSIPPVDEKAVKQEPRYANITDFNQALDQLADEMKVDYVDLSSLFAVNKVRYAGNGVHFKLDFYPLFLDYLMEFVK
ncbi:GDSL-type esterase/lipase family protein [Paenibacillus lautus]|uniref:GDSL-type esterase/lipase family protein n=1 Tax=Paenibacillus lautus TaxID=1401 RepID=UPI003D2DED5C